MFTMSISVQQFYFNIKDILLLKLKYQHLKPTLQTFKRRQIIIIQLL